MVVFLVILTIILFLTVNYFVSKREKTASNVTTKLSHTPLINIFKSIPSGLFLQPTFTWTKIMDSGKVMVGLQPALLGLMGVPDKIEMLSENDFVKKGDPIFKITHQDKELKIKSPIEGKLTAVNAIEADENTLPILGKRWFYTVEAENISAEMQNWYVAEKAQEWLEEKFQKIKVFLMGKSQHAELGVTMADGGDLPVGVLSKFDQKVWDDFETEICK